MVDVKEIYTRIRKYLFYLLAIFVLGWGFTRYQTIFLGLILGTSISFFNFWLLAKKVDKFGKKLKKGKKIYSLGSISRMATAIFAVFIAMEYPQSVHLLSVVIGLMIVYAVIMIDLLIQAFKMNKIKEKR
ncbi:ATP synthase subunit I [Bacillaceae bacterium Marseille-Q3522]|nr:ATP synthase subunit I [Bacillaceae bacterium Marseille-Q3522]